MINLWFTISTLSIGLRISSLILFFLLFSKFRDTFFRQTLYLQLFLQISNVIYIILLNIYSMEQNELILTIWTVLFHIITPLGIYIRLNWGYKIFDRTIPFPVFVGGIVLSVLVLANLGYSFISGIFDTAVPSQLQMIPVVLTLVIIAKNMDNVPHKSAIPFFKIYVVMVGIIVTANITLNVIDRINTGLDLRYVIALATEILNIILVLAIVRFFAATYFAHKTTEDLLNISQSVIERYELTEREVELILHLFDGHTAKEIGEAMCISTQTAKNYRSRIYQKLDVRNKIELIKIVKDSNLPA